MTIVLNRKHRFTSRYDPTRMTTQRRAMQQRLQHKFAILKGRIIKLVIDEDAFGLKRRLARNEHLAGGLGISRDEMPQIRHGEIGNFLDYCKKKGVKVTEERVPAASLRPVQSEYRQERIDEIDDKAADYYLFISEEGRVLDGTHRWLKRKQEGGKVNIRRIDLPVMEALKLMRGFDGAKFAANRGLTLNPFVSGEQRRACYAKNDPDPDWDCEEWDEKTKEKTENAFCPTGEGGGVDPSCSPHQALIAELTSVREKAHLTETSFDIIDAAVDKLNALPKDQVKHIAKKLGHTWLPVGASKKAAIEDIRRRIYELRGTAIRISPIMGQWTGNSTSARKESWIAGWDDLDWDQRNAIVDRRMDRAVWKKHTANTRFSFLPDPAKIKFFQRWLTGQFRDLFTNQQEDEVWYKYAEQGYKKGAGRAFDETNMKKRLRAQGQNKLDIYQGGREDFLQSAFGRPESIDKIKVLAGRSFDDLKHITADMSVRMTRSLADSLVTGQGVNAAAQGLTKAVGIGLDRARLMAHTELSRAHSEGQLNTFKALGVEELGVMVEWSTSGRYCSTTEDRKLGGCVCKQCEALEGIVVKVNEAQGMIPRHPGCNCAWLPANVGENQDGQKRGIADVEMAIKRSGSAKDWKPIAAKRLKPVVSPARNTLNH